MYLLVQTFIDLEIDLKNLECFSAVDWESEIRSGFRLRLSRI